MIKHFYKLTITLILCLIVSSGGIWANELHKLDIKKSSSNASTLNVTVYTSNPYDDNVAVTKKSDNKYVILLPNVGNSSSANVDYSSLKDVVSDVSVKTINDGANGYTKVTLTTTKPVSISASTRKSAPLTAEQKAYKNLIAQSRVAASKAKETTPKTASKTAEAQKSASVAKSPIPATTSKKEPAETVQNVALKDYAKTVSKETKNNPAETVAVQNKKVFQTENIDKSVQEKTVFKKKDNTLKELQAEVAASSVQQDSNLQDASNSFTDTTSQLPPVPTKEHGKKSNMPVMLLSVIACAIFGMKFFKTAVPTQTSYPTNNTTPYIPESLEVSNVENINHYKNWQEKYKNYVAKNIGENIEYSANTTDSIVNSIQEIPQPLKKNNAGVSNVVKNPVNSVMPEIEEEEIISYEKPASNSKQEKLPPIKRVEKNISKTRKHKKIEIVEIPQKKVSSRKNKTETVRALEKAVHNSPPIEKLPIDAKEIDKIEKEFNKTKAQNKSPENNIVPVKKEEEKIPETIRKSPKLKAFASKISIEKTDRAKSLEKKSSGIIRATSKESAYVNLASSVLYKNSRKSSQNILTSADLISRSKPKKAEFQTAPNKPYTTISIDEFFDTGYNSTASYETSNKVAEGLARLSKQSNPLFFEPVTKERQLPKPKSEPLSSKKICSAYNISKNKGFYIIDDESGNSSLIGVVNDNVTVLGQFGKIQDKTLKVIRQDDENVYILRANGEKFLVEAGNEKIRVLLEL